MKDQISSSRGAEEAETLARKPCGGPSPPALDFLPPDRHVRSYPYTKTFVASVIIFRSGSGVSDTECINVVVNLRNSFGPRYSRNVTDFCHATG